MNSPVACDEASSPALGPATEAGLGLSPGGDPGCGLFNGGPPLAVLWEQSLLWGLVCVETLERLGVPFRLLDARDIVRGALGRHRVLLVPGGWAAHKVRALGEEGGRRLHRFIEDGGSYLGFCGGAGLPLSGASALDLVPLERMPLEERLPNASGRVHLRSLGSHPLWRGLPETVPVPVWWPSQFRWQPMPRSLCLAVYERPGSDFQVADLPVSDLESHPVPWEEWENLYGINLHPARLMGQPAIVEIRLGKGRLVLSYPHMETPGERKANLLLLNTLSYLDAQAARPLSSPLSLPSSSPSSTPSWTAETVEELERVGELVDGLMAFGERHLLWKWRRHWVLQWTRGIRGLEYGTLFYAVGRLRQKVRERLQSPPSGPCHPSMEGLRIDVEKFCARSKRLLLEEKVASRRGGLKKLGPVNETVDGLRRELFGSRMNHGGLCRAIFDRLDALLLQWLAAPPPSP